MEGLGEKKDLLSVSVRIVGENKNHSPPRE